MDRTATIDPITASASSASLARSALPHGATLDRYVVLEPIGSGGMGVVYAAFDPELDRKIALKLVHPKRGDTPRDATQRRLAREAQALARLSHPNVLAVHDVGLVGGQLYVATEWIDGWDLATWLEHESPSRSKILSVFRQGGAGLAAAHDAGLVHRDFKLGNVMIGRDGRVRVVDFGLALSQRQSAEPSGTVARTGTTMRPPTGVLGTPSYAAPEQWAGQTATAATDQFSFCVALYRALCGEPPFDPEADPRDPMAWSPNERPMARLPVGLQRLLRRGLSVEPTARYPSMHALLADLDTRRAHLKRRRLAAALVAVALGAGGAMWLTTVVRDHQRCLGGDERFAAVWSPARQRAIATRFSDSGLTYAADAWHGVETILDHHGTRWATMFTETCRATVVEATQSTDLLDRRMACLDQRLREVDALAEILAGDPRVIERAVDAASALPTIDRCADASALSSTAALPASPEQQREVDRLRTRLASAQVRLWTGDYQVGRDRVASLVPAIESLGYWPLTARALLLLGRFEEQLDAPEAADALLARALEAATAGGDDRVAAETLIRRVRVAGYQLADFERGARYAQQADATLARLNRPDDLAAMLAGNRGALQAEQGDFDAALASHRTSLDMIIRLLGPHHPRTGIALTRVGDVLREQGKLAEAATLYARALAISRQHHGDTHPHTARLRAKRGTLLLDQGDFEGARIAFEASLAASRQTLEAHHPYLAIPLTYLGHALLAAGAADQAVGRYQEALEILERGDPPDDRRVAVVASGLGRAASTAGDFEAARRHYDHALALRERVYGPLHPSVAETAFNLGEVAKKQGDFATALDFFGRALDFWRTHQPDNHFLIAVGLTGVGEALLGAGVPDKALPLLEQALTLQPSDRASEFRATTAFALARALGAVGSDPARARRLAEAARADFTGARATEHDALAQIDAWLARGGAAP